MSQEIVPPSKGDTAGATGANPSQGAAPAAQPSSQPSGEWFNALPEDLRGDQNITKYKSVEDIARAHVSAVSMLGRDKIPMPKSDAEFRDVYSKLGMPDNAKDYKFMEKDYGIPEEIYPQSVRDADKLWYQEQSHKLGFTQKQFESAYDAYMTHQTDGLRSMKMAQDIEMAKCGQMMDEVWGEAKDFNLKVANRAMTKFFGENTAQAIAASGLGRNFEFIQGMHRLGERSLEELGIDKRGNTTRTPEQINEEVANLQAHPAYFDKQHPEHMAVQQKVIALLERKR